MKLLYIIHFTLLGNLFSNAFFNNVYKNNLPTQLKYGNNIFFSRNYSPFGRKYYEDYVKRLNSKNITIQNSYILGIGSLDNNFENDNDNDDKNKTTYNKQYLPFNKKFYPQKIIIKQIDIKDLQNQFENLYKSSENNEINPNLNEDEDEESEDDNNSDSHYFDMFGNRIRNAQQTRRRYSQNRFVNDDRPKKSENFEVITNHTIRFKDIGGYDTIKSELNQCIDLLVNYKKYSEYNVRIPKGLILEGPPGNGKTLLAKGFAGECNIGFIPVSGSQFQEKYVGVGSTRVRELFELAKKNTPCIIFIDEIDAIGRKRSGDGESSTSERDNTLNELLVNLDGFSTKNGIFLMGATNRADLLDPALLRPGRIDKRIFINLPDSKTRDAIITIHLKGKPHDSSINIKDLVDLTAGLSGSQIENMLNEAMLNALRDNRSFMEYKDIDMVINKIMVGWQPTEHQFSSDILDRIAIHEMGHAIVGLLSKYHSKVSKVTINLSSPKSPGYTLFESSTSNIYTRESLFEHLMILLAGRIAEEVFYDVSVTTGAINDFEEAYKLAEKMVIYYGMGKNVIYPSLSDKYKEYIDDEVNNLINHAYQMSYLIVKNTKEFIKETADILKNDKLIKVEKLNEIINTKYPEILQLTIDK
jgi:cell division protease FtsH